MMSTPRYFVLLALLVILPACLSNSPDDNGGATAVAQELETEEHKTLYAIGLAVSQSLGALNLSEDELNFVKQGLTDGALKREAKVDLQEYGPKLQEFAMSRQAAAAEVEKAKAGEFLDKMAAEPNAERTESGLVYIPISPGEGDSPALTDKVQVHYHGTLTDGTVFDSSVDRGEPVTFPLNGVIACWQEGVQKMQPGGKAKLICPSGIAYGDQGAPPKIPGGATLVFEVELISVEG